MYPIELTSLVGALFSLWRLWFGVLTFDAAAYLSAVSSLSGGVLALCTLLIAGVSLQMGQCGVLFANQVPPRRFLVSLMMGIAWLAMATIFWVLTITLTSRALTGSWLPLWEVTILVSLGVTPLALGFLVLLPYLGNLLYYLFFAWTFINILFGLQALYDFNQWQAICCAGIGWMAIFLMTQSRLVSLEPLEQWLWRTVTGVPQQMRPDALADKFAMQLGSSLVQISDLENGQEKPHTNQLPPPGTQDM